MREVLLVCKHEIVTTLRRVSFWVLSLLMPALLLGLNTTAVVVRTEDGGGAAEDEPAALADEPAPQLPRVGLVDESGQVTRIPAGVLSDIFSPYPDADTAAADLAAGRLDQYVVVAADYVDSGRVTVYDDGFMILSRGDDMGLAFGSAYAWTLPYLLSLNLVDDAALAGQVLDPLPNQYLTQTALNPVPPSESETLGEIVAMALPYAFYFLLLIGSNYLMRSVVAEKENRTAELLLLTLRPRDLMLGKILGLGLVTLLQLGFWLGGALLLLDRTAARLQLATFVFPPGFVFWAVLFLVIGYLLYASVMAMAGAMATNVKDAGQVIWVLIVPLMPTLMFGTEFVESPDSLLVIGLSLFPFSAPSAMVTRLALGSVPTWQLAVSLLGLALTTYAVVQLAARSFRPRNLLSDTAFSWRRLATGWRG